MWCDLVMGPARVRSGRAKWLLIWDNVQAHDVASVLDVFTEWGICVRFLPKYMTDILQPVDIVPNGPIKAHIRSHRCDALYDYFQDWRSDANEAQLKKERLPDYNPPPTTMAGGISLIGSVFTGRFAEESFMQGVRRCFVAVGLAPQSNGSFVVYTDHKRGLARAASLRSCAGSTKELRGAALLDDVEFDIDQRHDSGANDADAVSLVEPQTEPVTALTAGTVAEPDSAAASGSD